MLLLNPPPAKSTSRQVCQDRNVCVAKPAYLPCPVKSLDQLTTRPGQSQRLLFEQLCHSFKNLLIQSKIDYVPRASAR